MPTTYNTGFTTDPNYTPVPRGFAPPANLADYFAANQSRIPGGVGLETASSEAIRGLLNPPSMFPDVNRQAAEVTAARGVGGSAAAYGTGLRMTDEERLRRIALGEQLLSGAYGRQPAIDPSYFGMTPYQAASLELQQRLGALRGAGGAGGAGGGSGRINFGGGGGGLAPAALGPTPWSAGVSPQDLGYTDWYGTRPSEPASTYLPGFSYPNPSAELLPLYPGGEPVGSTGYNGGFFDGGGYTPPVGTADYTGYTGIAGLGNLGGGLSDFSGLLDYYAGG